MFIDMKKDKGKLYDIFYRTEAPYFYLVNNVLAAVTLLAVLVVILETVPALERYTTTFFFLEWGVTLIFTAEYIARIVAQRRHPQRYIFSFFGIIDLLAIIPTFLGLGNLTFLKTARTLRILRLLRMIRLSKMMQSTRNVKHRIDEHMSVFSLSIQIYFATLLVAVTLFGTLMYVAEGHRPEFQSIPDAMIWATKVTLGGVLQHTPETVAGELLIILTRFFGLLLFGLMISIIGTTFKKVLLGSANE